MSDVGLKRSADFGMESNSMARTIIQGGELVLPEGTLRADLIIEGENIAAIAAQVTAGDDDRVIDAAGLLVLPGIIDAHTHIQLDTGIYKTADNWEIGTRAAAAGGVTTVIDFANQIVGASFDEALHARKAEAAPSLIDYTFHFVILKPEPDPIKLRNDLTHLLEMGITSLKVFTTYRPNYYLDDAALLHLFKAMPEGMIAMIHAENDAIVSAATQRLIDEGNTAWRYHAQGRPREAEIEAVNRVIRLAGFPSTQVPVYIAHCTTGDTIWDIHQHGHNFAGVYCETCPQYLLLDESRYESESAAQYILQPPLRTAQDREQLREFVKAGMIDVISTDTCDYSLAQKQEHTEFTQTPGGLPGIETLLPLMYTLFCDELDEPVESVVRLMTVNPARIFGLYPRKGVLQVGSDADIVLYDPEPESTIRHEDLHNVAGYSPYDGMRVKGKVRATFSRGELIYDDGNFPSGPGRGQFVSGSVS
jgi:dihydropyrimidinase